MLITGLLLPAVLDLIVAWTQTMLATPYKDQTIQEALLDKSACAWNVRLLNHFWLKLQNEGQSMAECWYFN